MSWLALGWGIVAASAVFIGAALGWFARLPDRVTAAVMAYGCGVLLALVAFDTLDDAFARGGMGLTVLGVFAGALAFTAGLMWLNRAGARHRKRSSRDLPAIPAAAGIVALATILDSVPESLIIGLNFSNGDRVALASVIAVFLSNIPESLAATTRMRRAGHKAPYVLGVWSAVVAGGGLATFAGYQLFVDVPAEWISVSQAVTSGALLVFVVDTMMPEAFAETREAAGLITSAGFITGFALTHGLA